MWCGQMIERAWLPGGHPLLPLAPMLPRVLLLVAGVSSQRGDLAQHTCLLPALRPCACAAFMCSALPCPVLPACVRASCGCCKCSARGGATQQDLRLKCTQRRGELR